MVRYKLDDLGWYQFEQLVQSLLKAELGIGIEDWAGRGDHGVDAFCKGALNFPSRHIANDGPFVFQAKFVENANSAGAKYCDAIVNAVRRETARIKSRTENEPGQSPRQYVLITNAPLQADDRNEIARILGQGIATANVYTLAGNDLCDLLDQHKTLRRSFPQLLSLRELDAFIKEAVHADIYEKSKAALNLARDYAVAFVPTSAYNRAWKILRKYHFVVLEGPPEMGKTAIAWVIALAQLANDWQVVAIDGPEGFFKPYDAALNQVFVADDAFGRTEYKPTRGSDWEAQLHRVYRQLNSKHWLIWTSRKHILERAVRVMDVQGGARTFPNPGAVLVNASDLTVEEKALILYRHARSVDLDDDMRNIIRGKASLIVKNSYFTPERICRLVQDRLPDLVAIARQHGLDSGNLSAEITEAIQNPTDRMRKSFRTLPAAHKWALVSLLEAGDTFARSTARVEQLYEKHCPITDRIPFGELIAELSEAFVKTVAYGSSADMWMDWIHPSYRDLVIDELAKDASLRSGFLGSMSLEGIELAVSSSGGSTGSRQFPLMVSTESWNSLEERSLKITRDDSPSVVSHLLDTLTASAVNAEDLDVQGKLLDVTAKVCDTARDRWDQEAVILDHITFSRFCRASELISPLPQLPDVTASWNSVSLRFKQILDRSKKQCVFDDPDELDACVRFWKALRDNEPRLLRQKNFPGDFEADIEELVKIAEEDAGSEPILDSSDEYRAESQRLASLCDAIKTLSGLTLEQSDACDRVVEELSTRSHTYDRRASEMEPDESDSDAELQKSPSTGFSIEALFSDL